MAATKRFSRYKKETSKAILESEKAPDPAIDSFMVLWRACTGLDIEEVDGYRGEYERILGLFRQVRFSAHEIERISLALADLEDEGDFEKKAGLFLSAAIERSQDQRHLIHVGQIGREISYLCVANHKDVTIDGDAGSFVAMDMEGGTVRIRGDAHIGANDMKGGRLIIEGDAVEFIAVGMGGGEILVEGEVRGFNQGGYADHVDLDGGCLRVLGNVKCSGMHTEGGGKVDIRGDADIQGDIWMPGPASRIRIFGDVACSSLGRQDKRGVLRAGGILTVIGDVKAKDIGKGMASGKIIVMGKLDAQIDPTMSGGEIYLEGPLPEHFEPPEVEGGRIFHRGKPIVGG